MLAVELHFKAPAAGSASQFHGNEVAKRLNPSFRGLMLAELSGNSASSRGNTNTWRSEWTLTSAASCAAIRSSTAGPDASMRAALGLAGIERRFLSRAGHHLEVTTLESLRILAREVKPVFGGGREEQVQ